MTPTVLLDVADTRPRMPASSERLGRLQASRAERLAELDPELLVTYGQSLVEV